MLKYRVKKAWNGLTPGPETPLQEFHDEASADVLVGAGILEKAFSIEDAVTDRVLKSLAPTMTDAVMRALEPQFKALGMLSGTGPLALGIGAAQADKTKSFGDFFQCVLNRNDDRIVKVYATTKAPLSEASGTGGGYLVPPEYLATLLRVSAERGVVRPRARVVPMGSRSIQIPALRQGGAGAAGQFQALGGMVASWTEEATTRPEYEPSFRQIELIAHELSGYSVASRSLMADSAIALDSLMTGLFADAIALHEDLAFLVGDGVGKPQGIKDCPAAIAGGPASSGTARTTSNTFKLADAAWMWANLLPASQENAVWIMNQSVIPQLIQLQDAVGNVIFLPNFYAPPGGGPGGIQASLVPMLFGRPIIFTEKLPVLGTKGDVILADFSYYLLGDRQAIEIAASEHVNFLKNQLTWRFVHRVDGQPWLDAPYSYQDGTTKVSPFVVLAA